MFGGGGGVKPVGTKSQLLPKKKCVRASLNVLWIKSGDIPLLLAVCCTVIPRTLTAPSGLELLLRRGGGGEGGGGGAGMWGGGGMQRRGIGRQAGKVNICKWKTKHIIRLQRRAAADDWWGVYKHGYGWAISNFFYIVTFFDNFLGIYDNDIDINKFQNPR